MTDSRLVICAFVFNPSLTSLLGQHLPHDLFVLHWFNSGSDFSAFVNEFYDRVDCMVLEAGSASSQVLTEFTQRGLLLPAVILEAKPALDNSVDPAPEIEGDRPSPKKTVPHFPVPFYHPATRLLSLDQIDDIAKGIEVAVDTFLQLPRQPPLSAYSDASDQASLSDASHQRLLNRQERLGTKLKERLGYLGFFYKRDVHSFLRNMEPEEKKKFMAKLKRDYRAIILHYFSESSGLNQKIDRYVTAAFFADLPTSQVVEIHIALMDEFSKQLKLEGRNEEILLDYRLALIDTLANLCELYRRSVPQKLSQSQ